MTALEQQRHDALFDGFAPPCRHCDDAEDGCEWCRESPEPCDACGRRECRCDDAYDAWRDREWDGAA